MENLRVYEAARKLNLETSELMARLADRGSAVTGPIDIISQADFDAIAEDLKGAPPADEATEEQSPPPTPVLRLAPRDEKPAEAAKPTEEATEPVEPVAEENPTSAPQPARTHHVFPSPHHPKPSRGSATFSYVATGVAALALLLAVGLYASVKDHETGIATLTSQAATTEAALQDAALNAETALTMSVNNTNRIAQVDQRVTEAERSRMGGDLTRQSAALEELSATLPAAQGERVAELARRLESLARSL